MVIEPISYSIFDLSVVPGVNWILSPASIFNFPNFWPAWVAISVVTIASVVFPDGLLTPVLILSIPVGALICTHWPPS